MLPSLGESITSAVSVCKPHVPWWSSSLF